MNVKLHCPFCGQKYELEDFKEGAEVECEKCMRVFKLERKLLDSCVPTATGDSHLPFKKPSGSGKSTFIITGSILFLLICLGCVFLYLRFATAKTEPVQTSTSIKSAGSSASYDTKESKAVQTVPSSATSEKKCKDASRLNEEVEKNQEKAAFQKALMFKKHGLNQDAKRILIDIITEKGNGKYKATALHLLGMIEFEENHINIALETWQTLVKEYPDSSEAVVIKDKIKQLTQIVGEMGRESIDNALAESYLQNGRFWSRGRDTVFHIDSSWISNLTAAIKWYDKTIKDFPGTTAARVAYEEKMRSLQGWKEPGQYGESYGIKDNVKTYLPMLIQTFNDYVRDFPDAPARTAFRFQIAQIYWGMGDNANMKKWLDPILNSQDDSFYKDLAKRRLAAPVPNSSPTRSNRNWK
jgi:tetratricopeptide (TPR) repeat protein